MTPRASDPPPDTPRLTLALERTTDPVPGGDRENDPRLTARTFADLIGYSPDYVRAAIREGDLPAAMIKSRSGRPSYRLTVAGCLTFLERRAMHSTEIDRFRQMAARRLA